MSSPTKVLFLGMDAGDKFLIQEWAADGTLPTFRSLLERGLFGDTMSLEGFLVGAHWPSLYTGVSPAHHGFHYTVQMHPGSYEFFRCYPHENLKREPFWDYLCRAGRRVAILDIPLSFISKDLNGIQIVEWGSHDALYGFCAWPAKLEREILARFGPHPLVKSCDNYGRTPQDFCAFRDLLIQGVKRKTELTNYYLNKGGWDLFAQVFSESHCVGHQCWHLHDRNHPSHDSDTVAKTGNPIRDVYAAIDAAIGEILAHVDNNTTVVFLAGHRMSYNFGANFMLPEILVRLELAETWPSETIPVEPLDAIDRLDGFLSWGWQHTPTKIKEKLEPLRNRLRNWIDGNQTRLSPPKSRIDGRNSKCFPLYNGNLVSGIRVNLVGREPEGRVKPGLELNALYNELAEELGKIVDLESQKPVIKSVKKTGELYQGEYLDHLPDLLIEWNDEQPRGSQSAGKADGSVIRLASDKIGIVEGVNTFCRTGDHRPEGLFIALGPGLKAGRLGRTVSIMDFAPTFTSLLGVELHNVDGEPIPEILDSLAT